MRLKFTMLGNECWVHFHNALRLCFGKSQIMTHILSSQYLEMWCRMLSVCTWWQTFTNPSLLLRCCHCGLMLFNLELGRKMFESLMRDIVKRKRAIIYHILTFCVSKMWHHVEKCVTISVEAHYFLPKQDTWEAQRGRRVSFWKVRGSVIHISVVAQHCVLTVFNFAQTERFLLLQPPVLLFYYLDFQVVYLPRDANGCAKSSCLFLLPLNVTSCCLKLFNGTIASDIKFRHGSWSSNPVCILSQT